jgi:Carboxypeptidase regulatory-like domain
MTSWGLRTILTTVVLLLAPCADDAFACACIQSGPPCQAAWTADVVFAGTVRAIDRIEGSPGDLLFDRVRVTFDVEQGYINPPSRVVEVRTGSGGGDCGYSFKIGKRYLVYGWNRPPAGLTTGICSRTRPIEDAAEDLHYLKTIPPKGAGARVYGRINEWRHEPAEERGVDYGPLEGIRVSVQSATMQVDAVTDADGRFEVKNVPAGKATITVLAPFGFDARYLSHEIDITDPRACSAQDFTLTLRATASGTVVDASGRPLAGVQVDAVAAELAGYDPPPYLYPVKTDAQGAFAFDSLPPGRYVFGINLTKRPGLPRPGASVFLPGVAAARDASVIELKAGDEAVVGVLRLPAR